MDSANVTASILVSALLADGKVWDESAETTEEIALRIGKSKSHTFNLVSAMIKSGRVERVWRRIMGRPVSAYRVKK